MTPPHILLASSDVLQDYEVHDGDEESVATALRALGVTVDIASWDADGVDWHGADAVVIRSTWDYVDRRDEFLAWCDRVAEETLLFNPAEVVRWNTHKSYLIELEDRGVPVVPTAWLGAGDNVDLAELAASRGWREVVAKPAIGAGSDGLIIGSGNLGDHQTAFAALTARRDVMVQPLLHRIRTDGEISVTWLGGNVSHAIRKLPAADEWRVQIEFGGDYQRVDPNREMIRLAEWIVDATGADILYARVDLVPSDDGSWQLAELELVEPALYLDWAEGSADRMAAALLSRLA